MSHEELICPLDAQPPKHHVHSLPHCGLGIACLKIKRFITYIIIHSYYEILRSHLNECDSIIMS